MNELQNIVTGFLFVVTSAWLVLGIALHIIAEIKHGYRVRRQHNQADIAFREQQARQGEMLHKHNAIVRKKQLAALSNIHA